MGGENNEGGLDLLQATAGRPAFESIHHVYPFRTLLRFIGHSHDPRKNYGKYEYNFQTIRTLMEQVNRV